MSAGTHFLPDRNALSKFSKKVSGRIADGRFICRGLKGLAIFGMASTKASRHAFCIALKMFPHTRIDMPIDLQPNHSIGLKLECKAVMIIG